MIVKCAWGNLEIFNVCNFGVFYREWLGNNLVGLDGMMKIGCAAGNKNYEKCNNNNNNNKGKSYGFWSKLKQIKIGDNKKITAMNIYMGMTRNTKINLI